MQIPSKNTADIILLHIEDIVRSYNNSIIDDLNKYIPDGAARKIITRASNLIIKTLPADSLYRKEILEITVMTESVQYKAELIFEILLGLKEEIKIGLLDEIPQMVRGDLFENFLDMATHLLEENYKDASAVIAGSCLETHIKKLAIKNNIPIKIKPDEPKSKNKKTQVINEDLAKNNIYTGFDQKQITAWLDLRNNAAHGYYSKYTHDDVCRFIEWLSDFIKKTPA